MTLTGSSVWQVTHGLLVQDRTLVLMRCVERMSYKDLSEPMAKSEVALRVRVHLILRGLERDLTESIEKPRAMADFHDLSG